MEPSVLNKILMERNDLKDGVTSQLQRGRFGKPDVFLVSTGEGPVVVKDVGNRHFIFRWTLGLWSIRREWRIYARLKGIPGIPQPLKRIDRFSFSIEFIPARPVQRGGGVPSSFFRDLEQILKGVHGRGVVHLDLRHKGNILVSETGSPFLIDFNSGIYIGNGWLRRFLLPLFQWIDHGGVLKLKWRVAPSSLIPEERRVLNRLNLLRKLWVFN